MTRFSGITSALSRAALATFGSLAAPRLSVLIYHRVHRQADSLLSSEPDASSFDRLVSFAARTFCVLTLGEAARHLACACLPKRALVITFDDGYADNADVALPILLRHGVRASFFVSSGFLDGGRMWNDTVIESVRRCRLSALDLTQFGLGVRSLDSNAERRQVIDVLLPRIKYASPAERADAVARVQRLCRVDRLPDNLMMTSAQVRRLHAAGMEIGAHTVSHPILKSLSPKSADEEIGGGRAALQTIIDAPVEVFAYPNGKPDIDYDVSHVGLVRKHGFLAAVTTAPGVACVGDDLFQLPRYTPWGRELPVWVARLVLNQRNRRYALARSGALPADTESAVSSVSR